MASLIRRGSVSYALWYANGTPRRASLKTDSLQMAKEKLRQLEEEYPAREG